MMLPLTYAKGIIIVIDNPSGKSPADNKMTIYQTDSTNRGVLRKFHHTDIFFPHKLFKELPYGI